MSGKVPQTLRPPLRNELLRWLLPLVACLAAIPVTWMALITGQEMLRIDPCATFWENGWAVASSVLLWIAFLASIGLTLYATSRRRHEEGSRGAASIALVMGISVVCWVFSGCGYGWHCIK